MNGPARESSPGSATEWESCAGALYFSKAMGMKSKRPVCYGLSRRPLSQPPSSSGRGQLDGDAPGHVTNYTCVGYSLYNKAVGVADNKMQQKLPYCVGLEVVAAHPAAPGAPGADAAAINMQRRREREWATGSGEDGRGPLPAWAQRQSEGQEAAPPGEQGAQGGSFQDRFVRIGGKILERTVKNAYLTAETVRGTFEKLLD